VPHAIKTQAEKGKDGVVYVLMESQGLPADELLGFMLKKFPKNKCIVTPGQGLSTDPPSGGLPHAAMIGVDGTVLWHGHPLSGMKKIEELVDGELKKIKTGWGKSPEIKKARMLMYSKGQLGEAGKILDAAEQSVKPEAKDDFDAAKAELLVRYEAEKKSVSALMAEGRFADAFKNAQDLVKNTKGNAEWEKEAAGLLEAFKTPENDKELKADQALMKIVNAWGDKAPGEDAATGLKSFAKKNDGTKAAERAKAFAEAVVYKAK
jgi:hypothetical protein